MIISKVNSVSELRTDWDSLAASVYQKRSFLAHLEKTNFSDQRYYTLYRDRRLCAGVVVYSLKVDLFTFSNFQFKLPMHVVGLPISCDESGLLGEDEYTEILLNKVLSKENGIVLCLNHEQSIANRKIIKMRSLPSMIFNTEHEDWASYLNSLRHPYRRRILKAIGKAKNMTSRSETCRAFSNDHYNQYLEVIKRSKTKLEVMSLDFFKCLPESFRLNSFFDEDKLLYWHITVENQDNYHFLFGGIDYSNRDVYDSYTNNLIEIVKEGIKRGCTQINLGQTAETSKVRLGANRKQKKMFLYHKNKLVRILFRTLKNQLSYRSNTIENNVYKKEPVSMNNRPNNKFQYAGTL